jgi:hypothetical protein
VSPYDDLRRRSSGKDSVEQEGVDERWDIGASEGEGSTAERCGGADEVKLPAGQAAVEGLPGRRRGKLEARECGVSLEPRVRTETAPEDPAEGPGKIRAKEAFSTEWICVLRSGAGRKSRGCWWPGQRGRSPAASHLGIARDSNRRSPTVPIRLPWRSYQVR